MERKEKKIRFYVKPSSQLTLFCLQDGIIVVFGENILLAGFLLSERGFVAWWENAGGMGKIGWV